MLDGNVSDATIETRVNLLYNFTFATSIMNKANSPERFSTIDFVLPENSATETSKDKYQNIKDLKY